ncbi:MAG: DEAD/DEAH box helicase [Desulfurococcaceae archaeon]
MTNIFKVRKWLEDDEFKELLKIADYLGFENGYKLFKLNIDKALRNGYTPVDVRNLIEEYADEAEEALTDIEKIFEEYTTVFEWLPSRGVVRIHIPRSLFNAFKEQLRKYSYRYTGASGEKAVLEILPYYAHDIYNYFKNQSLPVIDANNIFAEKALVFKPELMNITLRPYQEEALRKWVENDYRGIIALPTGSGKSIIAIAAIVETAVRTLIVAYTKEQVFQWRDFILKYTNIPSHMIGLLYSEEKKLAPITITTYQSGFRNMNTISPYFGMLLVDEVHHLPAEKFRYIALHAIAKYRMGLSATPTREDGKHEELFPLLGGIIYYKTPSELVEQGFLAPYTIITVKVNLNRQERSLYEQLRRKYRALVGSKKFQEVLDEARRGNSRAIEALKIHSEMRQILAKASSKIDKAVEIAKREYEKGSKVIIFTQYVEQAKEIADRLNSLLLTGETPEAERKRSLDLFKNMSRGILVVTTVGDEGIDIPDANVGIIVSGTGSRRQFIQRLGRLLRPKTGGSGAVLYEIVLERTPEELQARKRKSIEPGEPGVELEDT